MIKICKYFRFNCRNKISRLYVVLQEEESDRAIRKTGYLLVVRVGKEQQNSQPKTVRLAKWHLRKYQAKNHLKWQQIINHKLLKVHQLSLSLDKNQLSNKVKSGQLQANK